MGAETGLSLKEISSLLNKSASNIVSTFSNLTMLRTTVRETERPTDTQISIWYNRVSVFRFSLSGIKYWLEEAESGLKGLLGVSERAVGGTLDIYLTPVHDGQRVNMLHSWDETSADVTAGDTTAKGVVTQGTTTQTDGTTTGVAKGLTSEVPTFNGLTTQETKSELYERLAQQKNSAQSIEQGINRLENEILNKRRQPRKVT